MEKTPEDSTTMITKGMMSSLRPDWKTPKALYAQLDKEFWFDFDPCPPNPTFDGLTCEWSHGANYVNPPYGREIPKWTAKAVQEWKKGKTIVMLVPSRTDTRWWHDHIMQADEIRFIKGRLCFDDCKSPAPFPSAIIIFRPR